MFCKIKENMITSCSKTEIKWWIFVEEFVQPWLKVLSKSKIWTTKIKDKTFDKFELTTEETIEIKNQKRNEQKRKIFNDFNKKLRDYNSEYSVEDQKRFESKRNLANDVLNWWKSKYITKRAIYLNITEIELARIIKNKADLEEDFVAEVENARDKAIDLLW